MKTDDECENEQRAGRSDALDFFQRWGPDAVAAHAETLRRQAETTAYSEAFRAEAKRLTQ